MFVAVLTIRVIKLCPTVMRKKKIKILNISALESLYTVPKYFFASSVRWGMMARWPKYIY
jgi:hypothetical protein